MSEKKGTIRYRHRSPLRRSRQDDWIGMNGNSITTRSWSCRDPRDAFECLSVEALRIARALEAVPPLDIPLPSSLRESFPYGERDKDYLLRLGVDLTGTRPRYSSSSQADKLSKSKIDELPKREDMKRSRSGEEESSKSKRICSEKTRPTVPLDQLVTVFFDSEDRKDRIQSCPVGVRGNFRLLLNQWDGWSKELLTPEEGEVKSGKSLGSTDRQKIKKFSDSILAGSFGHFAQFISTLPPGESPSISDPRATSKLLSSYQVTKRRAASRASSSYGATKDDKETKWKSSDFDGWIAREEQAEKILIAPGGPLSKCARLFRRLSQEMEMKCDNPSNDGMATIPGGTSPVADLVGSSGLMSMITLWQRGFLHSQNLLALLQEFEDGLAA